MNPDLKYLLLQSISVLVQYKEFMLVFENNREAINKMPRSLLSAFNNRSWIPVTNILSRFCKGSGFASSKNGESSSATFQVFLNIVTFDLVRSYFCSIWLLCELIIWSSGFLRRFYWGRHVFMNKSCSFPSSIDFSIHSAGQWPSSLCPSGRCKIKTRWTIFFFIPVCWLVVACRSHIL